MSGKAGLAQPRTLAHFPSISPRDFVLSPDGKTAYIMNMSFNGAPTNGKYGILIIDISNPETPHLSGFIQGDFMTMHLSQNGKYLYLQERNLPTSPARGLLVFSTEKQDPELLCSNPFPDTEFGRHPFAYSFATFPDESLLAIREQLGGLYLYDSSNPCDQKLLFHVKKNDMAVEMVGYSQRSIITSGGGLMSYKLAEPMAMISSWRGTSNSFSINQKLRIVSSVFASDVALSTLKSNGEFTPFARFGFAGDVGDQLGSVTLSDSGWLYIGGNGKLVSAKVLTGN